MTNHVEKYLLQKYKMYIKLWENVLSLPFAL